MQEGLGLGIGCVSWGKHLADEGPEVPRGPVELEDVLLRAEVRMPSFPHKTCFLCWLFYPG